MAVAAKRPAIAGGPQSSRTSRRDYSMRKPEIARLITRGWICSVPSKMSKVLASRTRSKSVGGSSDRQCRRVAKADDRDRSNAIGTRVLDDAGLVVLDVNERLPAQQPLAVVAHHAPVVEPAAAD